MKRIVIVGAGQGGLQAAMSLRQEGFEGEITLIGAEKGLPYQRPPLSKAYLKTGDASALRLRPESFFINKNVKPVSGVWIDRIDRAERAVYSGEKCYHYNHLILATGTRNLSRPYPVSNALLTCARSMMRRDCVKRCPNLYDAQSLGADLSVWNLPPLHAVWVIQSRLQKLLPV